VPTATAIRGVSQAGCRELGKLLLLEVDVSDDAVTAQPSTHRVAHTRARPRPLAVAGGEAGERVLAAGYSDPWR